MLKRHTAPTCFAGCTGGLDNLIGKTGLGLLRYRPGPIVAGGGYGAMPAAAWRRFTGIRRSVPVVRRSALFPRLLGPSGGGVGPGPLTVEPCQPGFAQNDCWSPSTPPVGGQAAVHHPAWRRP